MVYTNHRSILFDVVSYFLIRFGYKTNPQNGRKNPQNGRKNPQTDANQDFCPEGFGQITYFGCENGTKRLLFMLAQKGQKIQTSEIKLDWMKLAKMRPSRKCRDRVEKVEIGQNYH